MFCSSDLESEYKIYVLSFCAKVVEPTTMKGSYGPSHLSCLFSGSRSSTLLVTACQLLFVLVSSKWCSSCFWCPLHTAPRFTQLTVTCSHYIVKTAIEPDWHSLCVVVALPRALMAPPRNSLLRVIFLLFLLLTNPFQLPREGEMRSLQVQGLCLVSSDVVVFAARLCSRGAVL